MAESAKIPDQPPYGDPEFEAWYSVQQCNRCQYSPDDCTCPGACIDWRDFYKAKSRGEGE